MKISEQTLKILKNFSTINPSILIRPGSMLSTKSIAGNIVAETSIEEEFPVEVPLYDLIEFLNILKLFSSPIIDFRSADENYIYICEEDNLDFNVRYIFANKNQLIFPERRPIINDIVVSFDLDSITLDSMVKASNVMQLSYMVLIPKDDGKIAIDITNIKNPSSNKFSINIDGTIPEEKDFKFIFRMDTLKMLPNDYTVRISKDLKSVFESDVVDYFVGLDINSKF